MARKLSLAKCGASVIGAMGALKVLHHDAMMIEFRSFGYPEGLEHAVGGLEMAAATGLILRQVWAGHALLWLGGAGVGSTVMRTRDSACPVPCAKVEVAWGVLELMCLVFIKSYCSPFPAYFGARFLLADGALISAGAASATVFAYATDAKPKWPGWGGLETHFLKYLNSL